MKKYLIGSLLVLGMTGCSSLQTDFTKTGDSSFEPIVGDCEVSIYTTSPKKPFVEVGIIDADLFCGPFQFCGVKDNLKTASKFRDFVKNDVCKAGGNAIFLWESTFNLYMKATVIKVED